jgi:PKD repeat protein
MKKYLRFGAAVSAFILFCSISALAQPSNDQCANATALTINGGAISGTNVGTVVNGPNLSCGGGQTPNDVWYSFIYPGGQITITTTLGSLADTRIGVRETCSGSLIACNDDVSGTNFASIIVLDCTQLTAGNTYLIQAGGYQQQTGAFSIQISGVGAAGCTDSNASNYAACASSDDGSCTYPPLVASFSYSATANCSEYAVNFQDNSTGNIAGWSWSFPDGTPSTTNAQNPSVTFPGDGLYTASLTVTDPFGGSNTQTQNIVVSGGSLVEIAIVPDNYPGEISWELIDEGGTTVASGGSTGTTLCIAGNCHQFNIYDSFGDGICCGYGNGSYTITIDGVVVQTGGNYGSGESVPLNCPPGSSCDSPITASLGTFTVPVPNSWYAFTPDLNGQYRISTCNLATCDTKIWVYDYCNMANFDDSNAATHTYNDDLCGVQAEVTTLLAAGQTYYIRIGDSGGACGLDPFDALIEYIGPVEGCMDELACNYMPIAEIPATCYYNDDPNCSELGPDLLIREDIVYNSLYSSTINVTDNCLINEGCAQGYGARQVLRFTTQIQNIGNQDYFIGVPTAGNSQFEWDECHNHYHYEGYAEYLLYDQLGNPMPQIGFKNGFCVLDLECSGGGTAKYGCGNMGITAGCGDIYSSGLACQWIDITDVPAGDYFLVVRTNWDQSPDQAGHYELRYDNNFAQVCVHFERDANNNIVNFTKNIGTCPQILDCLNIPFGTNYPDCEGNCPGMVKRADLDGNLLLEYSDVHNYLLGTLDNSIPVSTCTDLNNDGMISAADAAYLDVCIHGQEDLGVPAAQIDACPWDDEIVNAAATVTFGIGEINTTDGYVDITILNPDNEVFGFEFDLSGLTIESVSSLLPFNDWQPHLHGAVGGVRVSSISHNNTFIQKFYEPTSFLRVHYTDLTSTEICISEIIDAIDLSIHNTLVGYGPCQTIPEVTCAADFNNDGFVGASDMLIFLGAYGCVGACGAPDLNNDGFVNTTDLLVFLGAYGSDCN